MFGKRETTLAEGSMKGLLERSAMEERVVDGPGRSGACRASIAVRSELSAVCPRERELSFNSIAPTLAIVQAPEGRYPPCDSCTYQSSSTPVLTFRSLGESQWPQDHTTHVATRQPPVIRTWAPYKTINGQYKYHRLICPSLNDTCRPPLPSIHAHVAFLQ